MCVYIVQLQWFLFRHFFRSKFHCKFFFFVWLLHPSPHSFADITKYIFM